MKVIDLLTLVEYNQWANHRIMRRISRLTSEQLHEPCWLSQGNLWGSLVHVLDAQWSWRLACQEGAIPMERLGEGLTSDLSALRKRWKDEDDQLIAYIKSLNDSQMEEEMQYTWPRARPRGITRWHVLAHIVNHGTNHRSEMGLYLAELGQSPGDMDFIIYASRKRK